jgi:hypothetical protein
MAKRLEIHEKLDAGAEITAAEMVKHIDGRFDALRTSTRWLIGILLPVILGVLGFLYQASTKTREILDSHKENSAIHRTPEETAAEQRADAEWKEYVRESLQRIERRLDRSGR